MLWCTSCRLNWKVPQISAWTCFASQKVLGLLSQLQPKVPTQRFKKSLLTGGVDADDSFHSTPIPILFLSIELCDLFPPR